MTENERNDTSRIEIYSWLFLTDASRSSAWSLVSQTYSSPASVLKTDAGLNVWERGINLTQWMSVKWTLINPPPISPPSTARPQLPFCIEEIRGSGNPSQHSHWGKQYPEIPQIPDISDYVKELLFLMFFLFWSKLKLKVRSGLQIIIARKREANKRAILRVVLHQGCCSVMSGEGISKEEIVVVVDRRLHTDNPDAVRRSSSHSLSSTYHKILWKW